jgi:hypothetical protein
MNFEKSTSKWPTTNVPYFSKYSSKSFETLDLVTSIHKKNIVEVIIFRKLQNGGVIQDGATSHYFILSGLAQPFLN